MAVQLNRTKLDDVETFWGDASGPLMAALTFRVGVVDESIPNRGITHMVEHLALQNLGRQAYTYNGVVDHLRTTLFVKGSPEEIVVFLSAVTGALVDLPLGRLEHEREVLLTETERYTGGPLELSLAVRYGPRGPGLLTQDEFGLHQVTAEELRRWVNDYFRTENAVLWMSGPPPEGIRLEIPPGGRRIDVPITEPAPIALPAWYEAGERGVALTSLVPRSTAATALSNVLEHRLQSALRYERGISYETAVAYMPVAADLAVQGIWTDTLKQNVDQARDVILSTIQDLASKGPSEEELDRYVAEMERAWSDVTAVPAILDAKSLTYLLKPEDAERDVIAETRETRPPEVREAAQLLISKALALVPQGCRMPPSYSRVPEWSDVKLRGKTFQPKRTSDTALTHRRLIQGDRGVTLIHDRGQFVSIAYDECEGLIQWRDGSRALLGSDGFIIRINPDDWRKGKQIVGELDRQLADRAVAMRTELPIQQAAGSDRRPHLRWALVSGFFALGALANLLDPEVDESWIVYLVMFLVLSTVCVHNARRYFADRGG